jgi:hypothetical protein
MTYRALLVGNSTFEADATLNPLNAPTKDVARLHRALIDSDTGLFADENVRLVTERKHDEILDELDEFFASGCREDLMLFYYSGHGILDEHNHLYLCGRDTRSDRLARSGVSDDTVNTFIRAAASMRTIVLLDCCSSGMFKGGAVGTQLGGPGRYIVSSARGKALANDARTPTGTSLFTEHLVEGLLGGAPDTNGDGLIDLHEIYDYVKKRLAETSTQIPHCRFDGDGDISLARMKRPPAVARATEPPQHRSAEAPFGLSESAITLRDVDSDEKLAPEVIEIYRLTDSDVDLVAETFDEWLDVEVRGDRLVVSLSPREGNNRGKVLVRDRRSGSVQALRVEAFVRRTPHIKGAEPPQDQRPPDAQQAPDRPRAQQQPPSQQSPSTQRPPFAGNPYASPGGFAPNIYPPANLGPAQPPIAHQPPPAYWAPPPPPGYAPTPTPNAPNKGTNGLAITSLVLSLLWLYWIGSILAIIFGRMAKKKIEQNGQGGKGMATAGIVIGWIGMALLVLAIIVGAATSGP